jgi:brefeldin A-inhibited guanine nucleotide-exchange protein
MRFLEKEELPHFKFQKDFLKPFEYTMTNNRNPEVRDMVRTCFSAPPPALIFNAQVLQCLQQMIQARAQNMRSGWRTMFGVFSSASKVSTGPYIVYMCVSYMILTAFIERIASSAFEIVTRLNKDHFSSVVQYGAFADLTICITEFCKVSKYQKISLLAIAMLRGVIPVMLDCPECALHASSPSNNLEDSMIRYWFPVLFGFYDIIMNGEDLEVRRLYVAEKFFSLCVDFC